MSTCAYMTIATYNILYAISKDDRYDLICIAETVRGADIIALQAVERNYGPPDGPSQPEDIATLLPEYYIRDSFHIVVWPSN